MRLRVLSSGIRAVLTEGELDKLALQGHTQKERSHHDVADVTAQSFSHFASQTSEAYGVPGF